MDLESESHVKVMELWAVVLGLKNLCPVKNVLFFVERVYTTVVHCLSSRGGSESPDGNSVTRIFGVGVSRIIFHPAAFVKGVK